MLSDRRDSPRELGEDSQRAGPDLEQLCVAVVDHAPVATLVVDREGIIALLNREAEALLGYTREELLGTSAERLVAQRLQDSSSRSRVAFVDPGEAGAVRVTRVMIVQRRDGSEIEVELTLVPLDGASGQQQILASLIDITARKLVEEDLRRSNAELEEFASVASHDLQEPLRMVASYTELFAKRYSGHIDDRADKYVHYIVDGARRMQRLIDDLLAVSRVGTHGKHFEEVDCGEILRDVLVGLGALCREVGAEITQGDLPRVIGNRAEIGQVFQNLLHNSMKYRSTEPLRIAVESKRVGKEWVFSVADNGIGFDMEHERRIFQMFKRLHAHGTYEGSGIGLALVKRIVHRHRGLVWAESAPGDGATFFFTLPTLPSTAAAPP